MGVNQAPPYRPAVYHGRSLSAGALDTALTWSIYTLGAVTHHRRLLKGRAKGDGFLSPALKGEINGEDCNSEGKIGK